MPIKILEQFAAMMPTITAREQLSAYEVAALASGNMKRSDAQRALRTLETRASGGDRPKPHKPKSETELMMILGSSGIVNA